MTHDELTAWVRRQLAKGTPAADIRAHALNWGLPAAECDALLSEVPPGTVPKPPRPDMPPAPDFGPGSELKALLGELELGAIPGCDCELRAAAMNRIGVAGCRQSRDSIARELTAVASRTGFLKKAVAAARALASGLAFRLDLADLYGSLVDEAIRRAAAKEARPP